MAKKIWTEQIDKHVNWGGDESTGNWPVSGERVQEFLKNSLSSRIGALLYNEEENSYYLFADEEDKLLYEDNPIEYSYLVLDVISLGPRKIFISDEEWEQMTIGETNFDAVEEGVLYYTYEDDEPIIGPTGTVEIDGSVMITSAEVSNHTLTLSGQVIDNVLYT